MTLLPCPSILNHQWLSLQPAQLPAQLLVWKKLTLIPFNRFYFAFFILKLTETKGEFTFFSGHDWCTVMQKIILSAEKKFTYTNRCNLLIILLNFGSLLEVIEKKNKFFNWRIHLKHVSYQFPRFKICFDENFFLNRKKMHPFPP